MAADRGRPAAQQPPRLTHQHSQAGDLDTCQPIPPCAQGRRSSRLPVRKCLLRNSEETRPRHASPALAPEGSRPLSEPSSAQPRGEKRFLWPRGSGRDPDHRQWQPADRCQRRSRATEVNSKNLLGAGAKVGTATPANAGKTGRPGGLSPCLFLRFEKLQHSGCLAFVQILHFVQESFFGRHSHTPL